MTEGRGIQLVEEYIQNVVSISLTSLLQCIGINVDLVPWHTTPLCGFSLTKMTTFGYSYSMSSLSNF